jgi:hypothetical protein
MNRSSSWLSALALAALFGCSAKATPGVPPQGFVPAPQAKSASITIAYTHLHAPGNGPIAFGPAGTTYVDLASLCFNYDTYVPCSHSIARVSASGQQSLIGNRLWCSKYNGQRSCESANALLAPPDGSLWIARDDGVLLRLPPGRFSASAMQKLPSSYGRVVAMAADYAGHVWIASFNKKGHFELFATTVHAPQTSARLVLPACSIGRGVSGALAYASGNLYVLGGVELWIVSSAGLASCAHVPSDFAPSSGFAQLGGAMIFGNSSGGLYSLANGTVTPIAAPEQNGLVLAPESIAASNGSVYFTFDASADPHNNPQNEGIEVFSNGSFSYLNLGHGVGSVATSPSGTLYISAACAKGCLGRLSGT